MKRLLSIAFIFLAFVSYSQNYTLNPLSGPFGANVTDMVLHSSGAVAISTSNNGVWRTADGGQNWTRPFLGTDINFTDLDIDPSGNLYAVTAAKIYKSIDVGVTWNLIASTGITTSIRKIRAASSSIIWIGLAFNGATSNVMKSSNSGTSFSLISTDVTSTILDLDVNPQDINNNVFVSTSGQGVMVSTNGFSFTGPSAAQSVTTTDYVYSVVVNGTGAAFALTVTGPHKYNGSGNWVSIKGTIAESSFNGQLALDPSQNLTLINTVAATRKIYIGNTTGSTWSAGTVYPSHINVISAFEMVSSATWYAASANTGVYTTANSGGAWSSASGGMKSFSPPFISSIPSRLFVTAQNRIFMAYNGYGYYQSIDNGSTWTQNSAAPADREINGFVKLANNDVIAYGSGGVIKSSGTIGNTWTSVNTTTPLVQVVTYDGINLFGFSSSTSTLLKSIDGGVTWTPTVITGASGTFQKIQVDATNNVYVKTTNNTVYKIATGGSTAAYLSSCQQDFSVYATGASTSIYVLTNLNNLNISLDGGTNWSSKTITSTQATRIWAFRNDVLVTGNSSTNVMNFSTDGGTTWKSLAFADSYTHGIGDVILGTFNNVTETAIISPQFGPVNVTTATIVPPKAPTNLAVLGYDASQVQLIWNDNSDNETDHLVEMSVGDNQNYSLHWTFVGGSSPQGKYLGAFTLDPNTTYYFRVAVKNSWGQSAYTNEVNFTTLNDAICSPTAIPDNRSWTSVTVADPGSTATGPGPFTNPLAWIDYDAGLYWVDSHLLGVVAEGAYPLRPVGREDIYFTEYCGQTYVYWIGNTQVDMANGVGTWDPVAKKITLKWQNFSGYSFFQGTTTYTLNATDPAPYQPSLNGYIYSDTEALLNWSFVQFEKQYKIYRSATSGGAQTLIATVNYPKTTYIDKNLTSGSHYFYKISAVNDSGESPQSNEIDVQIAPTIFRPVENDFQLNFENQQGASWGDLDGDGDEDMLTPSFTNNQGKLVPPIVYENNGNGQFTRKDITELNDETAGVGRAIHVADFNNDGKLDFYISFGTANDKLYLNNGAWSFTEIVNTTTNSGGGLEGSSISDYNNDGWVDVFVAYDNGGPNVAPVQTAATLKSELFAGASGNSFAKVTDAVLDEIKNCRTVTFVDYDNDGDQDIFALESNYRDIPANPYFPTRVPSKLYRNNGNSTFTKMTGLIFDSEILTEARTQSWGDVDNDGDLDLYVGLQATSAAIPDRLDRLYINNGGTFTNAGGAIGDNASGTYGSTMGDIDNDGDLDIMAINQGANRIFLNNGSGTFTLSTTAELFVNPNIWEIGGSMVDYDKDGFLDIYPAKGQTATTDLPNLLYRNVTTPSATRNWLEIKLVGTVSNRAAIGARVTSVTTSPARSQIRELMSVTGYGSENSLIQHFGLGAATTANITVRWPSGLTQTLNNVTANQIITIAEDNTGPAVVVLSPANGSTGAALNGTLEITLNETPTKVASKNLKLYLASNLTTPVQTFDVSTGVVAGNKITFTPSAALVPNTLYQITLDDGAFKDIYNNSGVYNALAWQFTSLDITAPVFGSPAAVFPAQVSKGQASSTFKVDVSDNVSVSSVTMSYRGMGSSGSFTDVSGTLNAGKWEFAVLESFYNTVGLEFYFTAKDADNNITVAPANSTYYNSLFETEAPTLTVPSPAEVSKGFGTKNFTVTATDNFSIASVVMSYRNTKDGVAYTNLTGTLDASIPNQYNFSVPEAAFNGTGLEYYLTATDPTGNSVRKPSATATYQMLIETTPPVITINPVPPNPELVSKTFTSRPFSVSVTDNFAVNAVVMSYRNTKTGVAYTDVSGTLNPSVASQYDFSVPVAAFNGDGLEYYFTATDASGNTIRKPLLTDALPTFKMLLDNQTPVVGPYTADASLPKANKTFTVKASDNLAVTSVVMKYRGIAEKTFTTSSAGVKNSNGDYDFDVQSTWFDAMGLEYYFRAVDASKNVGVSPDTTTAANKYYKTFVKYDGASLPKLTLIKGSTGASGYQIVSVPLELSNKNIADNFEELGTIDKAAYRFLRYHSAPTQGWDEYPGGGLSVLNRGEGYFLNSLKAEQITLLNGVAPQIDQSNLFQMVLKKGWNQIGNPYTVQIQWSDVIAYNSNPAGVSNKLTKYDNGYNTSDASGIIEPYKGGFVQVDNDVTLKIPFKGFTSGGRMVSIDSDLGQQNWELPFTLTQKDITYQMGLIGMNKAALATKDNFDLPIAPRLGDYIEASFDHPEHFMKQFSQDVVTTQSEYAWEFNVTSNLEGEAVMNWNNTSFGDNNKEVYLMDVALQKVVNMREANLYRFDPKESNKFKIFFGENLETKIKPSRVSLSKIYPNPTNGLTNISFAIPEQRSNAHVKLEVYDIMGKKMLTLTNGNLLPGFYNAEWDVTHASVVDGLYICRLLVSSESGEEVFSEKIVVKK